MSSSFQELSRSGLDLDEFWRHLIAWALLNDRPRKHGEDRTSAFTAGPMHDLGRIAMANADPERYSWVIKLARNGRPTSDAETELFGYDHEEHGLRVAEEWQLPEPIREAAGHHHDGTATLLQADAGKSRAVPAAGLRRRCPTGRGSRGTARRTRLRREADDLALGGPEGLRTQVEWFRSGVAAA